MAVHIVAEWREGTYNRYKKLDAQTIYDEIRSIGSSNGTPFESVSNQEFVDYARNNPNSESYKAFEWDDTIAAETFRRAQAKDIKNALITYELKNPQVILSDDNEKNVPIPLFLNPEKPGTGKGMHSPTEIIMQDMDSRNAILHKAVDELRSFQNRYHYLDGLKQVFDAINNINIP